jgi:hypothetical protein
MNHPICPTAHPTRSPAAATHDPFRTQEKATRAIGRYGAVIVMRPKREIGVVGCLLDQRYIGTKAREEDRKGRLNSGDTICETNVDVRYILRRAKWIRTRSITEERRSSQK